MLLPYSSAVAFDVHLAETFVPLALGMPLLSAQRSQLLESLPTYVNKLGVTHLGIVPTLIEATLNAANVVEGTMALRYIASGGEKMSESVGIHLNRTSPWLIIPRSLRNGLTTLKCDLLISMGQVKSPLVVVQGS